MISTRKLVDSDDEQRVLEELLDARKPKVPPEARGLHYLLFTPFRYPPLRHGSRFGARTERGIWYGSLALGTAFAETAYYRLLFLEGTTAALTPLMVELSVFRVRVQTRRGTDLSAPPFDRHLRALASKTDYRATQAVGAAMRADGIEAFVFRSARDPGGGDNVGVFEPGAFAEKKPRALSTWLCVATRESVEMSRKDVLATRQTFHFDRHELEVRGRLPSPAP